MPHASPSAHIRDQESRALKSLFKERTPMSQGAFGRAFSLGSAAMVYQYLSGRRPLNLMAGSRFARGLQVDLAQISERLAGEADEIRQNIAGLTNTAAASTDFVSIPFVSLRLTRGSEHYQTEPLLPLSSYIAFRRDWMISKGFSEDRLLAIRATEQGMQTTISQDDPVVLNTADTQLREREVYAFNYEGQLLLRRAFRDIGQWWLTCDNPDKQHFPRKQFNAKHCYTIGRAVHRQSDVI